MGRPPTKPSGPGAHPRADLVALHRPEGLPSRAEPSRLAELRARFDRLSHRRTGFAVLDRLLERLHADKSEPLWVLEYLEIRLHTNGSENDIRAQVTRRKVGDGTRSKAGHNCRDAFLGLAKTYAKLGLKLPGLPRRPAQYSGPSRRPVPSRPRPSALPRLPDRDRFCSSSREVRVTRRINPFG